MFHSPTSLFLLFVIITMIILFFKITGVWCLSQPACEQKARGGAEIDWKGKIVIEFPVHLICMWLALELTKQPQADVRRTCKLHARKHHAGLMQLFHTKEFFFFVLGLIKRAHFLSNEDTFLQMVKNIDLGFKIQENPTNQESTWWQWEGQPPF